MNYFTQNIRGNLQYLISRLVILLSVFLLCNKSEAQEHLYCTQFDANNHEREKFVDFTHLTLDISINPIEKEVSGNVTHTFIVQRTSIDSLWLDAPSIQIKSVHHKNNSLVFRASKGGVYVFFKESLKQNDAFEISINYTAKPIKGIYFVGWEYDKVEDPTHMIRNQIWTQGQGINNRHWIPMYDDKNDKVYTDISITFDKNYQVLSNGNLVKKKKKGNNITWQYKLNNPHPAYLIMFAIGEYGIKKTKTDNGIPVQFWYYPENKNKLEATSQYTEEIIQFLEKETGFNYPWGVYSQVMVQNFLYGAMENTSATIFADNYATDQRGFLDRNYINVNAHELVHQWFGNTITARTGAEAWLQESFATYYAKLFEASLEGKNSLKWAQKNENNTAKRADKLNQYPVLHSLAGSSRIYQKGSSILQMLKYVMGEKMYNTSIKYYVNKHKFGMVSTSDFKQAIIDKTGMNLDWFFDQWVYRGGIPHYKIDYTIANQKLLMNVKQIQKQSATIKLFKMPINIAVYYKDGSSTKKQFWIENESHTLSLNTEKKEISFVLFDENNEVMKYLDFEKSYQELQNQLKSAPNMIDRYYALLQLRKTPFYLKEALLKKVFENEKFWGIRAEIVNQFRVAENPSEFLKVALNDKNAKVRQAILNHQFSPHNILVLEQLLEDQSYVTIAKTLDKLMLNSPKNKQFDYLEKVKNIRGQSQNIKIKYLAHSLSVLPTSVTNKNKIELIRYTSSLYEFRTRINAMNELKKLNLFDKQILKNLLNASFSFNRRLASPARNTIKHFAQQTAYKKMIMYVMNNKSLTKNELSLLNSYIH